MTVDQAAHHVGFAGGPERGAALLRLLHSDELIDDVAPLHEQPMHRLVDAIDLAPQLGERRCLGMGRFRFGHDAGPCLVPPI